jgi:hypothetical protein
MSGAAGIPAVHGGEEVNAMPSPRKGGTPSRPRPLQDPGASAMGGGPAAALDDEVGHAPRPSGWIPCGNRVRQPPSSPFRKVLPSVLSRWLVGGLVGFVHGHGNRYPAAPSWTQAG